MAKPKAVNPLTSCYMKVNTFGGYKAYPLPCYPDEIGDSTSANWSDASIVGRSSPLSAYVGTGWRSVQFSFDLHREMTTSGSASIEDILKCLRATVYPNYVGQGLKPPIATFVFGNFRVRGIVRSVGFTWKKPIINNKYMLCTVSVQIDETPNKVYSATSLGQSMNPFGVSK